MKPEYRVLTTTCFIILLTSSLTNGTQAWGEETAGMKKFNGVKEGDQIRFYFILSNEKGQDGQVYLRIVDEVNEVLYESRLEVKSSEFQHYTLFGLTSIGEAYEWFVKFNEIKKGVGGLLGNGKALLEFTTEGQTLTAETTVEIPSYTEDEVIALYEYRYIESSKLLNEKIVEGDFEVTLVRLGYYLRLEHERWGG